MANRIDNCTTGSTVAVNPNPNREPSEDTSTSFNKEEEVPENGTVPPDSIENGQVDTVPKVDDNTVVGNNSNIPTRVHKNRTSVEEAAVVHTPAPSDTSVHNFKKVRAAKEDEGTSCGIRNRAEDTDVRTGVPNYAENTDFSAPIFENVKIIQNSRSSEG